MKFDKPTPELIDLFAKITPHTAEVEHKKMFGYPVCYVNGNMWTGLHGNSMIVRLAEDRRRQAIDASGAQLFEPMPGRPMKEYVVVPDAVLADQAELSRWLADSLAYASALPPKVKKPKKG